jgi:hypothetical protein
MKLKEQEKSKEEIYLDEHFDKDQFRKDKCFTSEYLL